MSGQRIIHPLRHTNGKVKGENGKVKGDCFSLMSEGDCFSLMSVGELIKVKTEM